VLALTMLTVIMLFPKSFALTHITDCTTLTQQGETYVLDNDIIDSTAQTCINIQADNVVLDCQGHTIAGVQTPNSIGINVDKHNYVRISNCVLTGWVYGIYLNYTIENEVNINTLRWNFFGIYINKLGNGDFIHDNLVTKSYNYGIHATDGNGITISMNKIVENWDGIRLFGTVNSIIASNDISNNNDIGLILDYDYDNIQGSNNNQITYNNITNNGISGILVQSSAFNLIYNNIFNNTVNYRLLGMLYPNFWSIDLQQGPNVWNPSISYIGGNAWFSPDGTGYSETCVDSDNNGFCDNQYVLANNNIDYLPIAKTIGQNAPTSTAVCGNKICEAGEDVNNCPQDCAGTCGDGICNPYYESRKNCPQDCGQVQPVCGNNVCESDENVNNCPQDCSGTCGDNICNPYFENVYNCQRDCAGTCGDNICNNYFGENPVNCPQDCQGYCGDGICNPYYENQNSCPLDCGQPQQQPVCGNGICEAGEDENNCPQDCLVTPPTGHVISGGSVILGLIVALAIAYFIFKKR